MARDDLYGNSIDTKSLINKNESSCSLLHCNPLPISKEIALEMQSYAQEHGEIAYMHKYIYTTPEQQAWYAEFIKNWR